MVVCARSTVGWKRPETEVAWLGTADTGVRPYDYAVTTSPTDFSMIAKNSSASCSVVTKGGAMPTQSWAGRVSDPAGFRLCNPVNWFSSLDAHPFARRVHRFPEIGASLHIEPELCTIVPLHASLGENISVQS